MPALDGGQWLSRAPDVLAAEVAGELALMSVVNGCYYALDTVASDIWRRLEQPRTVAALTAVVVAGYNGAPAQIERELIELLEQWLSFGLITVAPAGSVLPAGLDPAR